RWMAQEIAYLHKVSAKKRAGEIECILCASCAGGEVTKRIVEFRKQTGLLRYLANCLFIFLFIACPYMVWNVGMVRAIWPMVLGIYAQTILISLFFSKLHRKIYPA